MKFRDVMENNTANLNRLYVFDLLTPEIVWEFVTRFGMHHPQNPFNLFIPNKQYIEANMDKIDIVFQQFRAGSSDRDLKDALEKLFKVPTTNSNNNTDERSPDSNT